MIEVHEIAKDNLSQCNLYGIAKDEQHNDVENNQLQLPSFAQFHTEFFGWIVLVMVNNLLFANCKFAFRCGKSTITNVLLKNVANIKEVVGNQDREGKKQSLCQKHIIESNLANAN